MIANNSNIPDDNNESVNPDKNIESELLNLNCEIKIPEVDEDLKDLEINNESEISPKLKIKIIGIGNAGNNIINQFAAEKLDGITLSAVNTDFRAIENSKADECLLIGKTITKGLDAGGDIEVARNAVESDIDSINQMVANTDLLFLISGLGGGTGSGATPIIAKKAVEHNALVICFAIIPYSFEGIRRQQQARESLAELRSNCHAVIPIPGDILFQQSNESSSVTNSFLLADNWIASGIKAIHSMIFKNGIKNVEFNDLRNIFKNKSGKTLFGIGQGAGENYIKKAIENLFLCPLLHTTETCNCIDRLIVNITGGPNIGMNEVKEVMDAIFEKYSKDIEIIYGAYIEEGMNDKIELFIFGSNNVEGPVNSNKSKTIVYNENTNSKKIVFPIKSKSKGKSKRTYKRKNKIKKVDNQIEFLFSESEQRGLFEDDKERNLYKDVDLDVPTYLRRSIKLTL